MAQFFTYPIPWLRLGTPVVKHYRGFGACPYCGKLQVYAVNHDSSYKLTWSGFRALISCANHECGKQIKLTVKDGQSFAEKV
jgi:hypothetical protein